MFFLGSYSKVLSLITLSDITVHFSMPVTGLWFPSEVCFSLFIKACSYLHNFKELIFLLSPHLFCSVFPSAPMCSWISNEILFSFRKQNSKSINLLGQVMLAHLVSWLNIWAIWHAPFYLMSITRVACVFMLGHNSLCRPHPEKIAQVPLLPRTDLHCPHFHIY